VIINFLIVFETIQRIEIIDLMRKLVRIAEGKFYNGLVIFEEVLYGAFDLS
jgi:hypothetical protein